MLKGRCAAVRGGNQIYPLANFLREIYFIFKRFRANTESKIPCQRHATQGTEVFFKHSYAITELGFFFFFCHYHGFLVIAFSFLSSYIFTVDLLFMIMLICCQFISMK